MLKGLSIDNLAFGVAAVGPDGHESLVSAYVPPPRRDPAVKLVLQSRADSGSELQSDPEPIHATTH